MEEKYSDIIKKQSKTLINKLSEKGYKISFAESVTGGLLVSSLTKVSGASKVLDMSYVVYSNNAKMNVLGVSEQTIKNYSVYSEEVVREMLLGLKNKTSAEVLIAVSGIAGPLVFDNHEVGETYIGIMVGNNVEINKKVFSGSREIIQYKITEFTFSKIIEKL